ncbi:seipin isoform X7 [Procambarus clarkii]|uniref:seipin isoform X7 n=1 Tax=Procambarus clarkii TaxID=6728 RepID=UPI003742523A
MAQLLGSYIDTKRKAAWRYIEEWQSTAYSLVVFTATMIVMFWASVFLYTSFYFTYMPEESITWPINFHYRSCQEKPGICSNPCAIVAVTDPNRGSVLARGQKYRVVVDFEMPESPTNQRIGMFLINMSMKTHTGEVLRESSRSSMLRYKSPLLQTISTMTFSPLLLYGIQEEKQMVTVELFSQYEEDPVIPLSEVHVELQTRFVELYGAQLRIHAVFSGLRYLMYHYPLTAATMGIGICMMFLSAVVIFSWYQFSGPTLNARIGANQMAYPNGNALPISQGNSKSTNSTNEESMDVLEQTVSSTSSPKTSKQSPDSSVPGKAAGSEEAKEKGRSDHVETKRRDSDDFEVVSSSKMPDEIGCHKVSKPTVCLPSEVDSRQGSDVFGSDDHGLTVDFSGCKQVSSADGEEDCVIRQRIQTAE